MHAASYVLSEEENPKVELGKSKSASRSGDLIYHGIFKNSNFNTSVTFDIYSYIVAQQFACIAILL